MKSAIYTIDCKGCNHTVARASDRICPNTDCNTPNWGYTDDELRQLGFSIPKVSIPLKVMPTKTMSEYTIYCKAHGGEVAKTPNKICPHPACEAVYFGYTKQELDQYYQPQPNKRIYALKCKHCNSSVARTSNNRCLVCAQPNWGYSVEDLANNNVTPPDSTFKPIHYAIEAENIKKKYGTRDGEDIYGLQNTSLRIQQGQLVVIMGSSGCGKSTLLKCLNGENPATHGTIKLFGQDLHANYAVLKKEIGYVPQEDIVHSELTVEESLYYAAKIRLPKSTSEEVIQAKIKDVLSNLKLDDSLRNRKVANLSGGQRKRVSIAVELLNDPSILFLDEPTSPLDPETIDELFIKCLKKLTAKGVTILMVTHKPEDIKNADSLIFLGAKGYHAFHGAADAKIVCEYFGQPTLVDVYGLLSGSGKDGEAAAKKWHQKWYYNFSASVPNSAGELKRQQPDSLWHQYYWLSRRYARIKWSDKENMLLLLGQPIFIAGLMSLVFERLQVSVIFLTAISAIWFGVSNSGKEIVSELPIYKRERMYNLNLLTYIFSKISILALIAFVQVFLFVTILYLRYSGEIHIASFVNYTAYMFYLSISATLMGLVLSAWQNTAEKVATLIPICLMPQIMLAGIITKLSNVWVEMLSYFTLGRWGTESLSRIQDSGQAFEKKTSTTTVIESVWHQMPAPMKPDSLIWKKAQALKILNLYDKNLLGLFDSFNLNMVIISVLNLLMLGFIFLLLKRYDKL
jgi:ABC transport system ATP-binding/permease protein